MKRLLQLVSVTGFFSRWQVCIIYLGLAEKVIKPIKGILFNNECSFA